MEGWLVGFGVSDWFGLGLIWFGLVWLVDHHQSPKEIIHLFFRSYYPYRYLQTDLQRTPTSKTHCVELHPISPHLITQNSTPFPPNYF